MVAEGGKKEPLPSTSRRTCSLSVRPNSRRVDRSPDSSAPGLLHFATRFAPHMHLRSSLLLVEPSNSARQIYLAV